MEHTEAFVGSSFLLKPSSCANSMLTHYCFASDVRKQIWQGAVCVSVYMDILSQNVNRLCFYLSLYKLAIIFFFFKRILQLAVFGRGGGTSVRLLGRFVSKNNFSVCLHLLHTSGRSGCVQCFWKDDRTGAVFSSQHYSVSASHKVAHTGRVFKLCVFSIWLSFNSREIEEAGSRGTCRRGTKNNF